jgi:hypothetical protein
LIPAANLDDTKTIFDSSETNLLMVLIYVHQWEVWQILALTEITILVKVTMIQII